MKVTSTPYQHQTAAFEKMHPSRVGALIMDMGTGKSLVAIMLAKAREKKIKRVIWCCPVTLKPNVAREIFRHTDCGPNDVYQFKASTTDKNMPECFWYIVGLESISSSDREVMALNAIVDEHTMLIVDESSYIKGHRAKRTKRLCLIGKKARYRLVLNGTPISEGIEDLYAQMAFLSEKILGYHSWYSFSRKHLTYSEQHKGMIQSRSHVDWISARIAPYVYQVTKDECLDLPPKIYGSSRTVAMTPQQQDFYDAAKEQFVEDLMDYDPEETNVAIYRLFTSLQAIANGVVPKGLGEAGAAIPCRKPEALIETISNIPSGEPVGIWVRYRTSIDTVSAALRKEFDANISQYYGDLSLRKREAELARWRSEGGFFIATEDCGGFGLTLAEAAYSIFYSNGFSYLKRIQAEDRFHRIGQKRSVLYSNIWVDAGIEERIDAAICRKQNSLEIFRQELDEIRHLGRDAVTELLRSV